MQVTRVEMAPIKPKEGLIAFASLILDDVLFVTGIGVYSKLEGSGFRLTYPSRKTHEQHISLFHPLTPSLSHAIEHAISAKASEIFNNILN